MAPSPDPVEVEDFKLKQLCRLKIPGESYDISKTSSLLATSNIVGLIFVGTSDGFLGIKISDILKLDNETSSKKVEIVNYPHKKINLPSRACFLALSPDSLTLLVCIQKAGCPVGLLYDVRGYARDNGDWSPFQEVRLSATEGISVNDCAWNPTMPELLAVSLSDGSLVTVEVKDTQFTLNSLPPSTGIQMISWSPKGKQLVATRPGCITQYKPDLKEAKSIPIAANELNMEKPVACGIQWLSTSQFLVVYADQNDSGARPHLFIVNSYKNGPTKLIDYDDVCFGNLSVERPFRYTTVPLVPWNVILASSATAMEIAVLGQSSAEDAEHPEWTQWTLEDEFRAELPLSASNDETRPVGVAVDTTSQTPIPWGDNNQTIPPMPVLFVLSSNGLLCPFHVINLLKGASSFNQPPQVLSTANERKGTAKPLTETKAPMTTSAQPLAASTPFAPASKPSFFQPAAASAAPASLFSSFAKLHETAPSKGHFAPPTSEPARPLVKESPAPAILQPSKAPVPTFAAPTQIGLAAQAPSKATMFGAATASTPVDEKPKHIPSAKVETDDSGMGAAKAVLNEEITKFVQELNEFKARSKSIKVEIASEQDKERLMKLTAEMEAFGDELVDTTKTQDEEVRSLCAELVDLAALLDDARVRHARRKNPRYNHLLKLRPLDPASRRKMDSIEGLHMHIEQQLQEASRILDSISSMKPKDQSRKLEIPITQVIYEAMKNNAKVISQLKSRVERIKTQSKEQQLKLAGAALDALRSSEPEETKKWDSDLASLADSLLSTRIKQGDESFSALAKPVIHQVSPEKQAMLRNVLAQRPVARIRAARPESASESRLLSNLSLLMHLEDRKETELISFEAPHAVGSPVAAQKTPVGFPGVHQQPPKTSELPVPTEKPGLAADIEDITPPSTPVNLEQKAKALSGQPMINALALLSSAAGSSQPTPQIAFSGKGEAIAESAKTFKPPASTGVTFGSPQTQPPSVSKPAPTGFSKVSKGFGFGLSVSNQPKPTAFTSPTSAPSADEMNVPKPTNVPTTPSGATSFSFSTTPATSALKQPPTTTSTSSFGQPTVTSASSGSVFGQSSLGAKPAVGQSSLFGLSPAPSTPASATIPLFGSSTPASTTAAGGVTSTTTTPSSGLGAGLFTSSAFTAPKAPTTTASVSSVFGTGSTLATTSNVITTTPISSSWAGLGSGLFSSSSSTSTSPVSTAPASTAPASTAPASTAPASTNPASTAPASTAPASTAPASTAPASTAPASTAPASTAPASTAPASTAPASTAPASTAPASTISTATALSGFGTGLFSSLTSNAPTTTPVSTSPSAFGAGLFGSSATSTTPSAAATTSTSTGPTGFGTGLFSSSSFTAASTATTTTSASSSSATPTTSATAGGAPPPGLFKIGASTGATTSTQSTGPLFGAATTSSATVPPAGLFKLSTTVTPTSGSTAPPVGLFKLSSAACDASSGSTSPSPFGNTFGQGLFGQPASTTGSSALQQAATASSTTSDASSGSAFGKPAAPTPSPFGNAFGQGLFGQPAASATASSVLQPAATTAGSVFGQPAVTSTTTGSLFGQPSQSSATTFGAQPVFGQTPSVFGQNSGQNASANKPLFGGNAFASPSNAAATTSAAGSSTGFGAGLFGSMGLGSTPNAANAQKNVFGGGAVFGSPTANQGVLGSTSSTPFGAQSPPPTQAAAFGNPPSSPFSSFGQPQPAFGAAPSFGGSPLFGSKPAFGSGPTFSSPVSSGPPKQEGSGFSSFAGASNVPSFGVLASSGPSFGSLAQSANTQPAFGGAAFPQSNPPSFGGGSSFSTWR